MAIKLTIKERCPNCGTIHTRHEGEWIIEDKCPNPPPGPKCPPARWRASEVIWLPDPSRMVLVHTSEPGNHGGADCWCKPQLKPWEEAGLNPHFVPFASVVVGQKLPLDMPPPARPLTPTGEAIVEALRLVLPMAKGYAAEHPVGANAEIIEQAEAALAAAGN